MHEHTENVLRMIRRQSVGSYSEVSPAFARGYSRTTSNFYQRNACQVSVGLEVIMIFYVREGLPREKEMCCTGHFIYEVLRVKHVHDVVYDIVCSNCVFVSYSLLSWCSTLFIIVHVCMCGGEGCNTNTWKSLCFFWCSN